MLHGTITSVYLFVYYKLQAVPLPLQHGPIIKYHVRYRPAATFTYLTEVIVNNGDLKVNISGLLPWSWYSFLVEAENAGGVGPASSEIVVRTKETGTYLYVMICGGWIIT